MKTGVPPCAREPAEVVGDALALAFEQAESERRRLRTGEEPDLESITRAVEGLEKLLASPQTRLTPDAATSLIVLLDELGRLIEELVAARDAVRGRLESDQRHRRAGRAYRRAGRA